MLSATLPWAISVGSLALGIVWLRFEAAHFHRVWENLTAAVRR